MGNILVGNGTARMNKEQFWVSLQEPAQKGCWNCTGCKIKQYFMCVAATTKEQLPTSDDVSDRYLAQWEWDGIND